MSNESLNNIGDDDVKMPALEANKRTTSNTDIRMLASTKSKNEMDDGNVQLPTSIEGNPDHDSLIEWSQQHETTFDFPPMPPLPSPQSTGTTPMIARTFSHLSLVDESISPTLHEFSPTDLDKLTAVEVQSESDFLPALVCLPSLLEQEENSSFGNEASTQYLAGTSAMQGDIFSTLTFTSLLNVEDEYSNSFSLSEAEKADAVPSSEATAPLHPSSDMSDDDRWLQKFVLLQKYMAEHDGSCDVSRCPHSKHLLMKSCLKHSFSYIVLLLCSNAHRRENSMKVNHRN